jgi:hypothetical protein
MSIRRLAGLPVKLALFALVLALLLSGALSPFLLARSSGERAAEKREKKTKATSKANIKAKADKKPRTRGPARRMQGAPSQDDEAIATVWDGKNPWQGVDRNPREVHMRRSRSWDGDLRTLPQTPPVRRWRPEREVPLPVPQTFSERRADEPDASPFASIAELNAPAPAPTSSFDGLNLASWGSGWPPDTNGDVGPDHYIQTINASVGIYAKNTGSRLVAFTFDDLMSEGLFGNVCDTDNFGDPVVLYDTFEDRWVLTDFAFKLDGSGNVSPPHVFECFAVSQTGDPVAGGWYFYSVETLGGLGDYPKLGVWPDGIYMSVNMFGYSVTSSYQNARVYALNKAQMYAGAPSVQVVSFNAPSFDFTLLPSYARLQSGTPPPGTPNLFISTWNFLSALSLYKLHVDWNNLAAATFSGPEVFATGSSFPNSFPAGAPSQGGNNLDVLGYRAMAQNQYTNIGAAESLWTTHTVRRGNTSGFAAPRWYQANVTGGIASTVQAATWDPDGANVIHRFMPSLAVNRIGDMALGYSTSSSTTKPALKYAGRLAGDPVNTFSQTEQLLVQGAGTQVGISRWGDYSAMSLDPDGCTFWYTNEYYKVDGSNLPDPHWRLRVSRLYAGRRRHADGYGDRLHGRPARRRHGSPG